MENPRGKTRLDTGAEAFVPPARRFLETAARRRKAAAYYVRDDEGWKPTRWDVFRGEVRQAARALIALGVEKGDVIGIFGFTRPEWVIMDLAAMMVGAAPAGIYFTSSAQDAAYIVNHSQCKIVLAEHQEHFNKIASNRSGLNCLRHVIMMKGETAPDPLQMTWDAFLAMGDPRFDGEVEARLQATLPEDIGTLIYTSGTTGPPKAVQLSHGALAFTASVVRKVWKVSSSDRLISYLPLAHIAEQMITIHFQTVVGNSVYFAKSLQDLPQNLVEVRPTLFFGVPRLFEKMASAAQSKLPAPATAKGKLARWALGVGQEWRRREGESLRRGVNLYASKAIASAILHRKAKKAMGMDKARLVACGAAPISEDTLRLLNGLDIPIRELWGLSETSGAAPQATSFALSNPIAFFAFRCRMADAIALET